MWDNDAGKDYTAKVVSLQKYGAFVTLGGGVEGLIHISELSHGRVARVEDVLKVGEEVTVRLRDDAGRPSSDPERFALVQEGVRKHCPDVIIQFSTGGRGRHLHERGSMLYLRPDMASLATGSVNFPTSIYENPPEFVASISRGSRPATRSWSHGFCAGRILIGESGGPFEPEIALLASRTRTRDDLWAWKRTRWARRSQNRGIPFCAGPSAKAMARASS